LYDTLYNIKQKYYKKQKQILIISLKYSEAVRIVQEGCIANGIKNKLDELKDKYLSKK
jgi:hypothetical protein